MNGNLEERIEGIGGIRELINESRKHASLLENEDMFMMLCACLDTIVDTYCCLEGFLTTDIEHLDINNKYVYVYGTMQALFVEQKAVKHLCDSLGIAYTPDPLLKDIGDVRHESVGHPTNSGNAYSFISRYSIGNTGFELSTYYGAERGLPPKYIDVNVPELIAKQREKLSNVLDDVIKILEKEKMDHKQKFSGQKLSDAFHNTGYLFSKISEVILNPKSAHAEIADGHVDRILEVVNQYKTGLDERGELNDSNSYIYDNLNYSLQHLKTYFQEPNETHINKTDAYIFVDFARRQVRELKGGAEQLDEEYSQ